MDDFELEIKKEFINEAVMNLEEVESSFMELESSPDPKALLDKIFRLAHNLKGGSRAVGFGAVAEFTHQLESLVLKIQKGEVALSTEVITLLLRSNDRLVEMLNALKADMSAQFDNADLIGELQKWLTGAQVASGTPPAAAAVPSGAPPLEAPQKTDVEPVHAEPTPVEIHSVNNAGAAPSAEQESQSFESSNESLPPDMGAFGFSNEETSPAASATASDASMSSSASATSLPVENPLSLQQVNPPVLKTATEVVPVPSTSPPPKAPTENKVKKEGSEDEVIRVSLSKIDLLNDYVGELIVLQSMVQQQSMSGNRVSLASSIRQVIKLCKDIQSVSMGLRMLPVKPLIQKLQRVVRDTAKALDKEVTFDVVGDQLDIDKSVLDQLADPLIHILRNAVDHGLETKEGRTTAGKPTSGKVLLTLSNEGNHLVIEVRDDGKGINSQILRTKAIEKGLISETQSLTEKQLVHLIFHPGFSTKTETSEISGRGVGMDVVKTNIEKIGGQVDVQTQVGTGSIFRMQIPLSLAVIEGLVVASENSRYVFPISQIHETVNLRTHKLHTQAGIGPCFELRGCVVPIISLQEALTHKPVVVGAEDTVLIISVEDRLMGLAVTDILRSQQIVIKPLKNGIVSQKGWVGTCVLGDGLPTLILNPSELLQGVVVMSAGDESLRRPAA